VAAGACLSRSPPLARIICANVKSQKGCRREEASQLVDRLLEELRSRAIDASASGCAFISGSMPCSGTVLRSA